MLLLSPDPNKNQCSPNLLTEINARTIGSPEITFHQPNVWHSFEFDIQQFVIIL